MTELNNTRSSNIHFGSLCWDDAITWKKLARIDGILHLQIQDLKKRSTYPLGLMYVQFTSCTQGVAGKG